MSVRIHNITFDCADARGLAGFWSTVTGWHVYYDDDPEVVVAPSYPFDGTGLLFIPVPEGKTAKNRVHLDLQPETGTRDETVNVALAVGASIVADHQPVVVVGIVLSGALIGNNNTLITEAVMGAAPVERPVASAAYSFVRFCGGAIGPYVALKLFGSPPAVHVHAPFVFGAVMVAVGVVIMAAG